MLEKIIGVMMLLIIPMILFAGAFLGSAIDNNSMLAFIIGSTFVVLSAFNFVCVLIFSYLRSQMEN